MACRMDDFAALMPAARSELSVWSVRLVVGAIYNNCLVLRRRHFLKKVNPDPHER